MRLEQSHKQERHHTLTQNLKPMSLWILLLIRCSTFTLLFDVRHITHTCTQHSPSSVSPSIHHAPPQAEALTCLYRRCWFLRNGPTCTAVAAFCANGPTASVVPFVERGSDTIVGSLRGALGTVHIEARTTT